MADLQKILIEQADFALKSLQDMQEKAQLIKEDLGFQEFWLPLSGLEVIPEDIVVESLYGRTINNLADGNFHDAFITISKALSTFGPEPYREFDGFDKWDSLGVGEDIFDSYVAIGRSLAKAWTLASSLDWSKYDPINQKKEIVLHDLIDPYVDSTPEFLRGNSVAWPTSAVRFLGKYGVASDLLPIPIIKRSCFESGLEVASCKAMSYITSRIPLEYMALSEKKAHTHFDNQSLSNYAAGCLLEFAEVNKVLYVHPGLKPIRTPGYIGDAYNPSIPKEDLMGRIKRAKRNSYNGYDVPRVLSVSGLITPSLFDGKRKKITLRGRHILNQMIGAVYELRVAYCPGSPVPYQVCHASATPEEVNELNKIAQLPSPVDSLDTIGKHLYKN